MAAAVVVVVVVVFVVVVVVVVVVVLVVVRVVNVKGHTLIYLCRYRRVADVSPLPIFNPAV
jgi:hypothetical protein